MKITDPKLLKELYDTEADWKLLIGYRFKGCLPRPRKNGAPKRSAKPTRARKPVSA